jgi:hypothetical protein
VPVDPSGTVLQIDLRDLGWTPETWKTIVEHYPFGVRLEGAKATAVTTPTGSDEPFVRADLFLLAASRPPLYRLVLRLPETEKELAAVEGTSGQEPARAAGWTPSRAPR